MTTSSRSLLVLYNATVAKYLKFKSRYDRNVRSGSFSKLSGFKKDQILARLRKLLRKVRELHGRLRLAGCAGAFGLTMALSQASFAQDNPGPFQLQLRAHNPLRPAIANNGDDIPVAVDLDNDGDLDIVIGTSGGLRLLINNGTPESLELDEATPAENPFDDLDFGKYGNLSPAFADFDEDGDQDLFVGASDGYVHYFVNEGGEFNEVPFDEPWSHTAGVPGATGHPFYGVLMTGDPPNPVIVDYDGDLDLDILIGHNEYYDPVTTYQGSISILQNTNNESFSMLARDSDPFFYPGVASDELTDRSIPRLADIDGDDDLEPGNTVTIFTRWGDKVYEARDYDNDAVRFEGVNQNGKELASGTYFYRITFNSGRKEVTGYLVVKR